MVAATTTSFLLSQSRGVCSKLCSWIWIDFSISDSGFAFFVVVVRLYVWILCWFSIWFIPVLLFQFDLCLGVIPVTGYRLLLLFAMSSPAKLVVCPWPCLVDYTPKSVSTRSFAQATAASQSKVSKTFAQALSNSCNIPVSQLPKPCLKGEQISIKISENHYSTGVLDCQNVLYGRFTLPKGSTPVRELDLKARIFKFWKTNAPWSMASLGKGYYEFEFSSLDDLSAVRSVGSWNLSPGLLRMFSWTPDFNPFTMQQTTAQTWVRIHGLAREYWQPITLFEIAGALGNPLTLDEVTKKRTFGHFARVLIEVDLNSHLHDRILVERNGFDFYVDVEYENFCNSCQIFGHSVKNCKFQTPKASTSVPKNKTHYVAKPNTSSSEVEKVDEVLTLHTKSTPNNTGGCSKVVEEDPLITDMIRSKETVAIAPFSDVILLGCEKVVAEHMRDVVLLEETCEEVVPDSIPLRDLDYHQDDVLNPNIAHDLEILRPYLKGNDASASVPRVYTDEEEREAAINYLKNRSVAEEEPFIEVSNTKKKNVKKRHQVHITSARGRRLV